MGTREADQPVEQWSGPESLDPTPVWKQYVLVAALLVVGLIVVIAVSVTALAPQFVTPPALVIGDRLVLSATWLPAPGAGAPEIGPPVIDAARSFYLTQPEKGLVLALRTRWSEKPGDPECRLVNAPGPTPQLAAIDCPTAGGARGLPLFDIRGNSTNGFRSLDRYLVSVSGDRVIVNLSRVIESSERTSGPVPTGIPRPQQP